MSLLKRILLAAAISWTFSVTLGLLFAVVVSGRFSLSNLLLPGVVPVALIVSTAASIVITPVAAWALRTGAKNLRLYGPILWIALASFIVVGIPRIGGIGLYVVFFLGLVGVVILGFIPARK